MIRGFRNSVREYVFGVACKKKGKNVGIDLKLCKKLETFLPSTPLFEKEKRRRRKRDEHTIKRRNKTFCFEKKERGKNGIKLLALKV